MSKFVKEMAHLCNIYNVDFKQLAEELEHGFGQNLSAKFYFVLVSSLYNVQRHRTDDHAVCGELGSSDMEDMSKELFRSTFCDLLQCSSCH